MGISEREFPICIYCNTVQPSIALSLYSWVEIEVDVSGICVGRLLDRVQSEDPAWKESGAAFISSVTRLLERLLDYRSVIQGDENRDKRMSCTVNLLVSCYSLLYFNQSSVYDLISRHAVAVMHSGQ